LRCVVRHYAYDVLRHERTNRVLIAFDNEAECWEYLMAAADELAGRQRAGLADSKERISGVHWPAGYHAREQASRLARRLVAHGAWVPDELADDTVVRASRSTHR
jgi:hypothetical protein